MRLFKKHKQMTVRHDLDRIIKKCLVDCSGIECKDCIFGDNRHSLFEDNYECLLGVIRDNFRRIYNNTNNKQGETNND